MSKKKNKFDLKSLVHEGVLKEGQDIFFVSDPAKTARIVRHPSGEFKLAGPGAKEAELTTVHAFAQKCLGTEPPDHASKWLRTEGGKTLFDLWHAHDLDDVA